MDEQSLLKLVIASLQQGSTVVMHHSNAIIVKFNTSRITLKTQAGGLKQFVIPCTAEISFIHNNTEI